MEKIEDLRKKIDNLDSKLVQLIEERALIAKEIGDLKNQLGIGIVQLEREKEVLNNVKKSAKAIPAESIESVWNELMSACKEIQGVTTRVCYLGPEGTFTEIAAKKYFPKAGTKFITVNNFTEVFNKIDGDYADFGIIPIENSLEGSVRENLDLLIDYNLKIYGEIEIRVSHNLIAMKGAKLSDIKHVISHPQALAQCHKWLLNNLPNVEQIDSSSTSIGVKKVSELKSKEYAAIGTKNAAELYGMDILASGIEDNTQNYTRFLIISKKENMPTSHDKTSMVFVTKHIPGALHKVIKIFADANINLLKIESRPRKKDLWEYIFIIEFEGNQKELGNIIKEVQENTIFMKILGSYPIYSSKNFK